MGIGFQILMDWKHTGGLFCIYMDKEGQWWFRDEEPKE